MGDGDGFISNAELFKVLKMMVGTNLKDEQLQQIVDKTIVDLDKDHDGMVNFQEFCDIIAKGPGAGDEETVIEALTIAVPRVQVDILDLVDRVSTETPSSVRNVI